MHDGYSSIEENDFRCFSCNEDLSDWWLPIDLSWVDIDPLRTALDRLRNDSWLEEDLLDAIFTPGYCSCLMCGAPNKAQCTNRPIHKYLALSDVVILDNGEWCYAHQYSDLNVPVTRFYAHDGPDVDDKTLDRVPLDCRSCQWYGSYGCIPLRNAFDLMDDSSMDTTAQGILREISAIQIKPCLNYVISENSGFHSDKSAFEWSMYWAAYYGFAPFRSSHEFYEHVWGIEFWTEDKKLVEFISTVQTEVLT